MNRLPRLRVALVLCLAAAALPAPAFTPRPAGQPLDAFALPAPRVPGVLAQPVESRPAADALRAAWDGFAADHGGWQAFLDPRTGLPMLARGGGIRWAPAGATNLGTLEDAARAFVDAHPVMLGTWAGQMQLDAEASGPADDGRVVAVVFRQVVGGVPVDGARYDFQLVDGRLVAFGATRWAPVTRGVAPRVDVAAARGAIDAYLGSTNALRLLDRRAPELLLVPTAGDGAQLAHRLAWRFTLADPELAPVWVAEIDADSGRVVAFFDDTRYEQVKGGVFPVSDDGFCPTGCEQPGYPMPFADISINGAASSPANDAGMYSCSTLGSTIRTTFSGPYIKVHDNCGQVLESTTCDEPLDLKQGPGTDCVVPAGSSAGDTHSARSSFYHLNRVMQKGRAWLPDNAWLKSQVTDNVNINSTCNAFWDGASVNFYKSGGGCRNTGEIAGVFVHEWGHGIDNNDGGGYDNPSEAYADTVAFFETRESCVGRGFFADNSNCDGYGDACLNCSGIRDQDWNKHAAHTPATPAWVGPHCGSGSGGPCGGEVHCEAYVSAEAVWDLATRDLPASGLDSASSWQLAEKLFYVSRKGSGGDAYNCAGGSGDGCGTNAWFHKMIVADDDDGNLANGTPHAASIFAAFNRHGIACGGVNDPANQNNSACPVLATPVAGASAGSNSVILNWTPVPGAARYRILRNDIGCERAQIIIDSAAAPATSYTDDGLPNNFTFYYRVQAVGTSSACESAVSDCVSTEGQPFAGRVRFDRAAYGCSDTITLSVKDGNVGAATLVVTIASDSEMTPETVVLTETPPGSQVFSGSIHTTAGPAVHGDGLLSVAAGDGLTAAYRDANTGQGEPGLAWASSAADCSGPVISAVQVSGITDGSATIQWTTAEAATGRIDWGTTPALGSSVTLNQLSTTHVAAVQPFAECATVYFRVVSTDAFGNVSQFDAGGTPLRFNARRVAGAVFKDAFETTTGWTLEGEWQIAAPQGKGTPADPSAAFGDTKVLGHDLTGLGAHPGDYETRATERAISPVINAATLSGGKLIFRRWLNVAGGVAYIDVKQGAAWNTVWQSEPTTGVSEGEWSYQSIDISHYADGNAALQIAFRQFGGPNAAYLRSGWNIDRLAVKGGAADFEACTACGGAPSFVGASAAADVDPCGNTGVVLRWDPATAWGTGTTGTYSVYRDLTPNFTPSAANRIATGLAGTSYTDTAVANGATVYYLVRAENNETCSSGPANHGMTDANTAYRAVTPTASRPPAGAVADLRGALLNQATVRLTWGAAPAAAGYAVYRSNAPASGFQSFGTTAALSFDDLGAAAVSGNFFYSVHSRDACGNETP